MHFLTFLLMNKITKCILTVILFSTVKKKETYYISDVLCIYGDLLLEGSFNLQNFDDENIEDREKLIFIQYWYMSHLRVWHFPCILICYTHSTSFCRNSNGVKYSDTIIGIHHNVFLICNGLQFDQEFIIIWTLVSPRSTCSAGSTTPYIPLH